jgi:prophage antirepressor-like protein
MNAISNFTFHNDYNVRIIKIDDNDFLFHANDLCAVLKYANPRDAIRRHVDSEDVVKHDTLTNGGKQKQNYVKEAGMWALVLGSETEQARLVKRWVTSEVLPTLRKTGKYETPKPIEKRDYINNSDMLNIKRLIWACTHHISHGEAFKFGIWHSLRKVTGVPSPAKFEVQHLPILAQEFQRILNIVEPYFEARRECELALIKRVIRERGDHQVVKALLDEMKASTTDFNETLQKHLPMVFDQECLNLLNRNPNGYDHSDCNERLI